VEAIVEVEAKVLPSLEWTALDFIEYFVSHILRLEALRDPDSNDN
jgi:hypothetical protein